MTLELEGTALSLPVGDEWNAGTRNAHEPLVLADTGDPAEWLVVVQGSPRALAVAVIRTEDTGTYCYPHGPAHPRLGPYATAEDALAACREVQRSERCYDSCCLGV
jgi:hypothetical protein